MILPVGLLFLAELFERFTFYGVRAVLVIYMLNNLEIPSEKIAVLYGAMTGGIYIVSILGGLAGDLTRRSPLFLVIGSGLSTLGITLLAFGGEPGLIPALCLIALGSGIFKPNMISTLYSQVAGKKQHVDGIFVLLYFFINLGAFLAPICIGYFADPEMPNYERGFMICAGLSLVNTILLVLGLGLNVFDKTTIGSITKLFRIDGTGIAKVVLFFVLGISMWILYEMIPVLSGCESYEFQVSAVIGTLIFGILFAGIGFIPGLKSAYRITAGFLGVALLIVVGAGLNCTAAPFLLSATEMLIAPVLVAQIAMHVSPRFVGTIIAVYFFMSMLSNKVGAAIYDMPANQKSFTAYVFVGLCLASCVALLVLDRKKQNLQEL